MGPIDTTPNTQQVEATRTIRGGRAPGRNEPCPCGSGLKFRHCHGDAYKVQTVQRFAAGMMSKMIRDEQMKRGLIPYPWTCRNCKEGFRTPKESTVVPGTPMCPHCDSTDVIETEVKEEKNDGEEKVR